MSKSQRVTVNEVRRTIVSTTGLRLDLHNVTAFDPSGTHLRIWSDEGLTMVNPDKVFYHLVQNVPRVDES